VGESPCDDSCQFAAISLRDDAALVGEAACMGCGVCVAHCQEGISLVRDPAKGEPLEIQKLIAHAAQ
jgi:Fe-S-cluster-containing hydrogenase component 2